MYVWDLPLSCAVHVGGGTLTSCSIQNMYKRTYRAVKEREKELRDERKAEHEVRFPFWVRGRR